VIYGASKGGFKPTLFSPQNSLQSTMYAFGDTMVSIASRSGKIKTQACFGPAILPNRRYISFGDDL
jgi:hypothetical protein